MESGIIILPQRIFDVKNVEASLWDELGNVKMTLSRFISVQNISYVFGLPNQVNKLSPTILNKKGLNLL